MSELTSVEVAVSPAEKFREYLATRGKRLTRERETIVAEVFSSHEHFDIDELVSRVSHRTDGKRVSRATVYRTLNDMVKAGLLRKVARTHNREVYEHDYGYPQHDHLYCKQCHQLFEFHNEEIVKLRDAIAGDQNFRVSGHRFIITGVCEECRLSKRRVRRKVDLI